MQTGGLPAMIRNSFSRMRAALRKSPVLQPLHRRYAPLKYGYTLPAWRRVARLLAPILSLGEDRNGAYQRWTEMCERVRYDPEQALKKIGGFKHQPMISILLAVDNADLSQLGAALVSVSEQYYSNWELCICSTSTSTEVTQLLNEFAPADDRVKRTFVTQSTDLAVQLNRALELATGEWVLVLGHDGELTPDALCEVVTTLQETDADMIYSDEDRLDLNGLRIDPVFKPGWSPDLLLSCNYLGHFCVYRKKLMAGIGGFREGFPGGSDYDLALRFTEHTDRIRHIPRILYHSPLHPDVATPQSPTLPRLSEAGARAVSDALERRQIKGQVESGGGPGLYRVRRIIEEPRRVSMIIPTRDKLKCLERCIAGIEFSTDYHNYEILIVDNGSENADTHRYLQRSPHRVIRSDTPFNFSYLNNLAAKEASGEYLLFLNNDTEVIDPDWLSAMVEQAQRAEVGAVGAKLLYADGCVQHAGVVLGVAGLAGHAYRGVDDQSSLGYLKHKNLVRNYNAVTAACMMIRRDVFLSAGGFNEQDFPVSYNDVDLCLRLRQQGYLVTYTPYAKLYHKESATRGFGPRPEEEAALKARWGDRLTSDYYYNPNLSSTREDFSPDFSKPESLTCLLAQQPNEKAVYWIDAATSIVQEFFIEADNLAAVSLRLGPIIGTVRLRVRLRDSDSSVDDVATAEATVGSSQTNCWQIFPFHVLRDSKDKSFYLGVELVGGSADSRVGICGSIGGEGSVDRHFENHEPRCGAVALRLYALQQFR
jgi:GT2 family glycosyltransferase